MYQHTKMSLSNRIALHLLILLGYTSSMVEDVTFERCSFKEITLSRSRAMDFLGRGSRRRRGAPPHELGPNEIHYWPWYWIPHYYYFRSFYLMELRELKRYKGAWWGVPANFRFDYMPGNYEYERRIITGGKGPFALFDMVLYESNGNNGPKWKTQPGNEFMTLYWRYGQCRRGNNKFRNCPDPCNKQGVCDNIEHGIPSQCRSFYDPTMKVDISPKYRSKWQHIFQIGHKCGCKYGYSFDHKVNKCIDVRDDCNDPKIGGNPCKNGGTCTQDSKAGYKCECTPAYQGGSCHQPRDPCRGPNVCARFTCKRDPANWKLGYTCLCNEKPGWEKYSVEMPQCVDINECLQRPCSNGGTCNNTAGSYSCTCPAGWIGRNCEHRHRAKVHWGEWAPYGRCSQTCGPGIQTAYRKCSVPGRCVGTNSKNRKCRNVPRHCPEEGIFDDTFGLRKKTGANQGIYGAKGGPIDLSEYDYSEDLDEESVEEPDVYYNSPDDVKAAEEAELASMNMPDQANEENPSDQTGELGNSLNKNEKTVSSNEGTMERTSSLSASYLVACSVMVRMLFIQS